MRQSRASETPQGWWIGLSKRQAAVGDDRAGRSLRPTRSGQRPTGASLDALLLPPFKTSRITAARLAVLAARAASPPWLYHSLAPSPLSSHPGWPFQSPGELWHNAGYAAQGSAIHHRHRGGVSPRRPCEPRSDVGAAAAAVPGLRAGAARPG